MYQQVAPMEVYVKKYKHRKIYNHIYIRVCIRTDN